MDTLKELVEELNDKVDDLNSALYIEDLLSLIEDITEIANELSDKINDQKGDDSHRGKTSFILFKLAVGSFCFFVVYFFSNQ